MDESVMGFMAVVVLFMVGAAAWGAHIWAELRSIRAAVSGRGWCAAPAGGGMSCEAPEARPELRPIPPLPPVPASLLPPPGSRPVPLWDGPAPPSRRLRETSEAPAVVPSTPRRPAPEPYHGPWIGEMAVTTGGEEERPISGTAVDVDEEEIETRIWQGSERAKAARPTLPEGQRPPKGLEPAPVAEAELIGDSAPATKPSTPAPPPPPPAPPASGKASGETARGLWGSFR